MKSPKLVLIKWVDAYHLDGWLFGENVEIEANPCWTVGFVAKKNKKGIMVAQTWFPEDMANLIFIPHGMIQKITEIGDLKT
jgi:hypothetical protein